MGFIIESQSGTGHGSHRLLGQAPSYLPDPWVGHAYDTLWSLISGPDKASRVHKIVTPSQEDFGKGVCADVAVQ